MPKVVRSPSDVLAESPHSTPTAAAKEAGKPAPKPASPPAGFEAPPPDPVPEKPSGFSGTPDAETPVAPAPKALYRFVKNINPKEKIRFRDGTTFQFPSAKFATSDKELAAKLVSVGATYNIVEQ